MIDWFSISDYKMKIDCDFYQLQNMSKWLWIVHISVYNMHLFHQLFFIAVYKLSEFLCIIPIQMYFWSKKLRIKPYWIWYIVPMFCIWGFWNLVYNTHTGWSEVFLVKKNPEDYSLLNMVYYIYVLYLSFLKSCV